MSQHTRRNKPSRSKPGRGASLSGAIAVQLTPETDSAKTFVLSHDPLFCQIADYLELGIGISNYSVAS